MELLLWLYLFDDRWFFKVKIPFNFYKLLWLIPLAMHLIELTIATYDLKISTGLECLDSMRSSLYNRYIFSIMISLNILFFVKKLSKENEKENDHFQEVKKAYPILKYRLSQHDYWIRRNSLLSTSGIILLFQGLISFIWAYILRQQIDYNNHNLCDLKIQNIINTHSFLILNVNMIVLIIFAIMITTKIFFNILGHYFPNAFVTISKICHRKRSNIKTHHKVSKTSIIQKLET